MSTLELKNRIHNFLENVDDKILKIVNSIFENYDEDDAVNGSMLIRVGKTKQHLCLSKYD